MKGAARGARTAVGIKRGFVSGRRPTKIKPEEAAQLTADALFARLQAAARGRHSKKLLFALKVGGWLVDETAMQKSSALRSSIAAWSVHTRRRAGSAS